MMSLDEDAAHDVTIATSGVISTDFSLEMSSPTGSRTITTANAAGTTNPRPQLRIVRQSPSTATVDGDNGLGLVVGPKANGIAMDKADDVVMFRYNQLRAFIGAPDSMDGKAIAAEAWAKWRAAEAVQPKDWVGTATETQLAFPYLNLWGFPDKFHRSQEKVAGQVAGIAGSPGVVEGVARVVNSEAEFDSLQVGEVLVCQMTNPAWQVLYGKIIAVVTDAGGTVSHPAVLAREYGIPAVVGTSTGTYDIKSGDQLRVDGNAGVVEFGDSPDALMTILTADGQIRNCLFAVDEFDLGKIFSKGSALTPQLPFERIYVGAENTLSFKHQGVEFAIQNIV